MAVLPLEGALVFRHETLNARFVLSDEGLDVYVDGQHSLTLIAADVLALAEAAQAYYAAKVTSAGTVPAPVSTAPPQ